MSMGLENQLYVQGRLLGVKSEEDLEGCDKYSLNVEFTFSLLDSDASLSEKIEISLPITERRYEEFRSKLKQEGSLGSFQETISF